MESYLTEVKQLRIPRPKYEPNGSPLSTRHHIVRPCTPPQDYQDYYLPVANEALGNANVRKYQDGSTEAFRPSLHEKS